MAREREGNGTTSIHQKNSNGRRRSLIARSLGTALCVCVYTPHAVSGDWTRHYGVTAREVFTDNVCLSEDNERSEWITTAAPSFSVKGTGGRVKLNVSGAVELNNLDEGSGCANNDNSDNFNPTLKGSGTVELLSNLMFVDFNADVQQNSIDPFSASGDSNLTRNENRNTTYQYAVSPYLTHRLGSLAELYLRYTYDNQDNSENSLGKSDQQTFTGAVSSVSGKSPWNWSLQGNHQKITYDDDSQFQHQQDELSSVTFNTGYQFSRKWALFGSVGEEMNDYVSVNDDIDGRSWTAGFHWTPNPRTSVQASMGERFFGSTPSVSITHRLKHSRFQLSYDKSLTYTRSLRTETQFFGIIDEDGEPILTPDGEILLIGLNSTTVTRSPIVDERLRFGYRWSKGRTVLSLDGSRSEQQREEDAYTANFMTYSAGVQRKLTPYLTGHARVVMTETTVDRDSEALGHDSEVFRLYLTLVKRLGTKTSLSMSYTYSDRQSEFAADEYQENRVSVGISMAW